jgi:hypothetical protein
MSGCQWQRNHGMDGIVDNILILGMILITYINKNPLTSSRGRMGFGFPFDLESWGRRGLSWIPGARASEGAGIEDRACMSSLVPSNGLFCIEMRPKSSWLSLSWQKWGVGWSEVCDCITTILILQLVFPFELPYLQHCVL